MAKKKTIKCRNCKQPHTPFNSTDNWCKELDCQVQKGLYLAEKKKKKQEKDKEKLNETKENDRTERRKNDLATEIQKLARMIDKKFGYGCCCCFKHVEDTGHGCHYHNKQGNENIKFNLDNIHLGRAHCNMYNSEHKKGYKEVMKDRYGEDYAEYLENGIRLKYKEMHFTSYEIDHALKTTRKIIREFDTFDIGSAKAMREYFNKMIGLYK